MRPHPARHARHRPHGSAPDLGPAIRRRRHEVELEDGPDPDQPNRTVRRGRVADGLRRMLARGELEPRQFAAAEALRDLASRAGPAIPSVLPRLGMPHHSPPPGTGGPGTPQLAALLALRRALVECRAHAALLRHVVLWDGTLDAYARAERRRRADVRAELLEALELLAAHFEAHERPRRLTRES